MHTLGQTNLQRIVVLNPKGGSGKTTIATNLASQMVEAGRSTALMDCDRQGCSMEWLRQRNGNKAPIHGIAGHALNLQTTRSWQLRVPASTACLIVDTPAGLNLLQIREFAEAADVVLVPVLPSEIDIRALEKLICDIRSSAALSKSIGQLGIVANRLRDNTNFGKKLVRFLDALEVDLVAVFHDSQAYVHASDFGLGIMELMPRKRHIDLEQWRRLIRWLDARRASPGLARREASP